jgi:predicted nucleic acid-binding protein
VIVLDASVWVSSLKTADVNHVISRQWIAAWMSAGESILVPRSFLTEVGGAVARTSRLPDLGQKAIADVLGNPAIRLISVDDALVDLASRRAVGMLLRGADAVYVALAERLRIPLVTWDQEQLVRAASVIEVRRPTI